VGIVEQTGPGVTEPPQGQVVADLSVIGGYAQYAIQSKVARLWGELFFCPVTEILNGPQSSRSMMKKLGPQCDTTRLVRSRAVNHVLE